MGSIFPVDACRVIKLLDFQTHSNLTDNVWYATTQSSFSHLSVFSALHALQGIHRLHGSLFSLTI